VDCLTDYVLTGAQDEPIKEETTVAAITASQISKDVILIAHAIPI
jgi:hypothetical protein